MFHTFHREQEKNHTAPRIDPPERLLELRAQGELRRRRFQLCGLGALRFELPLADQVVTGIDTNPAEPRADAGTAGKTVDPRYAFRNVSCTASSASCRLPAIW